jgi:hypothetical protein
MNRLADLFVRYRFRVAVCAVVLTCLAGVGNARLTFDDRPRGIYSAQDEGYAFLQQVLTDFGSDDNDVILVVQADDVFASPTLRVLHDIVDDIGGLDGVKRVQSLKDAVVIEPGQLPRSLLPPASGSEELRAKARQQALDHPLIANQLLSEDGSTTLVIVRLDDEHLAVSRISPIIKRIREICAGASSGQGVQIRLTGIPPVRVSIIEMLQHEQIKFSILGLAVGIAIAWLFFRRLAAVAIIGFSAVMATFWAMGAMGLAGESINVINAALPTLVMVIALADAVHIIVDFRHSRSDGLSPVQSARSSIAHLAIACGLTSLTTVIGFGSLAVARVDIIQRFGLACALGTAVSFVAVMLWVPLLASSRLGQNIHVPPEAKMQAGHLRWLDRVIGFITTYPRTFAIGGVAVTAVLAATSFRLRPDNKLTEVIPAHSETALALNHCDEAFGGAMLSFMVVDWPESLRISSPQVLEAIQAAQNLFAKEPATRHPLSVIELLRALPGGTEDLSVRAGMLPLVPSELTHRFVRPDLRRALISAHIRDVGARAHVPVFDDLERRLAQLEVDYPGFRFRLTGTTVVAARNINEMIGDLARSLGLASVFIFLVLVTAFRSVRIGLICVIPNIFPLVFTCAILVLTGKPLQMTSVIVFSICLGIAVDDTIHAMTRFQREIKIDGDVRASIQRAFVAVGSALITTTAVLVAGFGILMQSDLPSTRLYAVLSCLAISSALIGDVVILPALMMCFAKPPQSSPPRNGSVRG